VLFRSNALLNNGIDLNNLLEADDNKANTISKTIKDSNWFYISWKFDPTINSMLRMLDAIHYKFKTSDGFYNNLTNETHPAITFQFLPINTFGSSNDLYIKMNSRGKPLTRFENFKAQFEKNLSTEVNKNKTYNLTHKNNVTKQEYFSHRIDTQWTDLFWLYKEEKIKKDTNEKTYEIDRLFLNFFATIAINHAALSQTNIRKLIDNQERLPAKFYLELDSGFSEDLICLLDLLADNENDQKKLKVYIDNNFYYNEKELFKKIIYKDFTDAAYWERIQFYAFYSFIIHHEGKAKGFFEWIRIITNLSKNTMPYNNDDEFIKSIKSIKNLINHSENIYDYLKKESSRIDGFDSHQIKEERIKAHLISINEEWKTRILDYEKHGYFKGQLTFALAFSGIEAYFDENSNCDWPAEKNIQFFQSFEKYIQNVFALFDANGLNNNAKENHRLHRAVLSIGDYLVYSKSNWSFLNDSDRDVSWKRFLLGDGDRKTKRMFFKTVIDDTNFNHQDLSSLDLIIKSRSEDLPVWMKGFIDFPELLDYLGNYKFIRFESENDINLLRGLRLSGEHLEFYSFLFFLKNKSGFFPFTKIDKHPVSGYNEKDLPCCYIDNWENKSYAIDIRYSKGNYEIRFFDRNSKAFNEKVVRLFLDKGMQISNKYDDTSYITYKTKEEDVTTFIQDLCIELKN
jgi:hypothetical protein